MNPSRSFERLGKISYDAINERIRIIDDDQLRNTSEYFDDLLLFKEVFNTLELLICIVTFCCFFFSLQGVGYRLNLKTRECDRFTLREDFRPIAVPPGARAMGEVYIGSSAVVGSGVLVKIFGAETERGKVLVVIFFQFWLFDMFDSNGILHLQAATLEGGL